MPITLVTCHFAFVPISPMHHSASIDMSFSITSITCLTARTWSTHILLALNPACSTRNGLQWRERCITLASGSWLHPTQGSLQRRHQTEVWMAASAREERGAILQDHWLASVHLKFLTDSISNSMHSWCMLHQAQAMQTNC